MKDQIAVIESEPVPTTQHYGQSLPPQDKVKHRAEIGLEVEAALHDYWRQEPSEAVKIRIMTRWMDGLERFPMDEIKEALSEWVEKNPSKKPNFGHIAQLIQSRRSQNVSNLNPIMARITEEVSTEFGYPSWLLRGSHRQDRACDARAKAIYLIRQKTDAPLTYIGTFFGGRDHTTILAAIARHERNMEKA